jgi:hypothetical protein
MQGPETHAQLLIARASLAAALGAIDAALKMTGPQQEPDGTQNAAVCLHKNITPGLGGFGLCRDCGTTVKKEAEGE